MRADERLSTAGADMPLVGRVLRIPTLESMRYRDYRLLWMSSTLVTSGSYFKTVLIGWLTYDVTGSALLTALAIGIESLPNLLASPIGGVLADRVDRRKLVATTAVYNVVLTFGMSAVFLLNRAEPWPILAYMLLFGIGHTMGQPAKTSYGAYIVPEKALLNAFSAYNTVALIGPAIALLIVYNACVVSLTTIKSSGIQSLVPAHLRG